MARNLPSPFYAGYKCLVNGYDLEFVETKSDGWYILLSKRDITLGVTAHYETKSDAYTAAISMTNKMKRIQDELNGSSIGSESRGAQDSEGQDAENAEES